ncbi:MAG: PHP domain-containing protein [Clostridia bacterium]|nr:PHP domain-containing protein [Clostridia bacterium]
MILSADYHTHTPYSHGKNTVLENAEQAKRLSLREIGITDHGFAHRAFGIKRKEMPALIRDCKAAQNATGVRVLVGVEANILSVEGVTDLKPTDYADFDLFICGKHVLVGYDRFYDFRKYFLGNLLTDKFKREPSQKLRALNTKAYINTIRNNPVDILSHLNHRCPSDAVEVAKCAADYGTYIELNSAKTHLTDDELSAIVAKTSARFVVDSDAHRAERVGDYKISEEQILRVGVPLERIDNIDGRLPAFRFNEYKKRM